MRASSGANETAIDLLAESALMALRSWLNQPIPRPNGVRCSTYAADRVLLLLDPIALAVNPSPYAAALECELSSAECPSVRLDLSSDDFTAATLPTLVDIGGEAVFDRLVAASVRASVHEACGPLQQAHRPRGVCGWLRSATSTTSVARELSLRTRLQLSGRRRLWRVWDPRVALAARELARAGEAQVPNDLHVHEYACIDWLGHWQAGTAAEWLAHPKDLATAERIGRRNALLGQTLHRKGALDTPDRLRDVDRALDLAGGVALPKPDCTQWLALDLLEHGIDIFEAPTLRGHLHGFKSGRGTYSAWRVDLDDGDWQALVREGQVAKRVTAPALSENLRPQQT
jgi:hypothetical protein